MSSIDEGDILAPIPRWLPPAVATAAVGGAIGAAVWVAGHVHPDHTLRQVAVFAHLACLVLGFGAVLAVDWVAMLWLVRRRTLSDVLLTARNAHVPAWLGYAGLILSGILLEPDLTNPITKVKIALVVVIGWNGVGVAIVHRQLSRLTTNVMLSRRLLTCACSGAVSQVGWWGAMLLGFLNGR